MIKPNGVVGTLHYMSPEALALFADKTGRKFVPGCTAMVDWFSYGVLVYQMLTGRVAFSPAEGVTCEKMGQVYPRILYASDGDINKVHTLLLGKFEPTEQELAVLTPSALSLVAGLVQLDPAERSGVDKVNSVPSSTYTQLKSEEFFDGIDWDKLGNGETTPPYIPSGIDVMSFSTNTSFSFGRMLDKFKLSSWREAVVKPDDQVHFQNWNMIQPEVVAQTMDGTQISLNL